MKRIIFKKGHLYTYQEIGDMFGVTGGMASHVAHGRAWRDILV